MHKICSLLILIGISLTGCQVTSKKSTSADFAPQALLPQVSFFASYLSEKLQQKCNQFNADSKIQHCIEDPVDPELYWSELNESGLFEQVHLSKDNNDYEILVSSASFSKDNKDGSRPYPQKQQIQAEISVTWRNIELRSYQYKLPLTIADPASSVRSLQLAFAKQLVSIFLQDAKNDRLFSAEFIYSKLNASDYQQDLSIPEHISDFRFYQKHQFSDPLQGIMVRYLHPSFIGDIIDLYVYPVADSNWTDHKQTIKHELDKVSNEMQFVASAQKMAGLNIGNMQELAWSVDGETYSGFYLSADAQDSTNQKIFASTYIFVLNDKYIKFTATFPAAIATEFIKQAIPFIQVPHESVLMAELRGRSS